MEMRPRIVLADDHEIVTAGLCGLLEPEFCVAAAVSDGEALIQAACALRPDLVVADISMPGRNGIDAIREILKRHPQIRAICLTMHADRIYMAGAFEAGAMGFVVKHAAADELRDAIRAVLRGRAYVSPHVGGIGAVKYRRGPSKLFDLTVRQRQVLQLVAEGGTTREVATRLNLTAKTVEFHKYRLIEKLGLGSSAELIQFAFAHGFACRKISKTEKRAGRH
jgi:DNA-binding NarL/FixJ family response regulator